MKKIACALLLLSGLTFLNSSCKKGAESCYSEAVYESSKNMYCATGCPGVVGCDGKTYCNVCEAARKGIRVD